MSAAKEIRGKIKSVKNTQKITKAMEMVAASKMRKAQQRMRMARPYGDKIRAVCAHLSRANAEYRHPYLEASRKVDPKSAVGLILVTTDKGLCGGLNTNSLRLAIGKMRAWEESGRPVRTVVYGNKGVSFMGRIGAAVISQSVGVGDAPQLDALIGPLKVLIDSFDSGEIGEAHLLYSRFHNTVRQEPVIERLLPLSDEHWEGARHEHSWDYLYEPEARSVVDVLLRRYVEAIIYQAVAENFACEQAARMVAMKAASDNAGTLIDELQLVYNKDRQATITKEISEIVGGAAAV